MRKMIIMAMAGLALAAPASVEAQEQNSRFIRRATSKDASTVFLNWAACTADLDGKWARTLLETVPTTDNESAVFDKRLGNNDRCLLDTPLLMDNKQLEFSAESGRGEIARYLARKLLKGGAQPNPGAATDWLHGSVSKLPAGASYNKPILVGHDFAACLVDEHWPEASAMVVADDAEQEAAAWKALSPHFGSCMTSGAKLSINRPIVRLLVGEAAYHALSHRAAAVQAAAAGAGV